MAIIFDSLYVDIIALLITVVVGVITYYKWSFKYWKKQNIPYLEPTIPWGTLSSPIADPKSFGDICKDQYDKFRANGYKHGGLFALARPMYMPIDPELIKHVVSKDFNHFVDRGVYYNERDDPISAHLFSIEGAKWRNLRMKLTPTFTSGKMKMMFHTLVECGDQLNGAMEEICSNGEAVDIKDVLGRFSTDIIGSCAFGIDCNSFLNPNSDFRIHSKRVFVTSTWEALKGFISFASPQTARFFRLVLTPKESADFFMNVIKSTVEYREKNNFVRKDFMQLLVDLKNNVKTQDSEVTGAENNDKGLTIEELAAQAFVFFIAGFETSSTTMTFCLFELATNKDIQEKVREEVNAILEKHGGKLTYDNIMEMKYLGQVIDETLRKYPPVPVLNRICVEEYRVPGTDLTIEKNTPLVISILGLQRDPEYFPDPEKFDPERFSDSIKHNIKPFTYMPFGEGPRVCIGLRFGVMQTKVGLAVLLKNFRFSLNNKTQVPLKMNPFSFILATLGDIWLDVTKVEE